MTIEREYMEYDVVIVGAGAMAGLATATARREDAGDLVIADDSGVIGLAGVMAARAAGCETIVAVDLADGRLELARELGATVAALLMH